MLQHQCLRLSYAWIRAVGKLFDETGPPPLRGPLEFRPASLVRVRHLSMRFFAFRLNGVEQLISLEMVTFVKTTGRRRLRVDRLGEIGITLW